MKNLVIVGTSGVGKTFLEVELEKREMYSQVPMYTDRKPRENDSKGIVCLKNGEFEKMRKNFSFWLEYCGHLYGWRKDDLEKEVIVIDLTMDDLERFMKRHPNFRPILLEVSINDLPILGRRMKKRGDSLENIQIRLDKTREELKNMDGYRRVVKKYNGLIFQIKNDQTIFEEVIPALAKKK